MASSWQCSVQVRLQDTPPTACQPGSPSRQHFCSRLLPTHAQPLLLLHPKHRLYDAINQRDVAALAACFAADVQYQNLAFSDSFRGATVSHEQLAGCANTAHLCAKELPQIGGTVLDAGHLHASTLPHNRCMPCSQLTLCHTSCRSCVWHMSRKVTECLVARLLWHTGCVPLLPGLPQRPA